MLYESAGRWRDNVQGIGAGLCSGGAKCTAKEGHMSGFMLANFDKAGASERRKTGVCESLFVELGEGTRIEGILEMLKGQSIVENGGVCWAGRQTISMARLTDWELEDKPSMEDMPLLLAGAA